VSENPERASSSEAEPESSVSLRTVNERTGFGSSPIFVHLLKKKKMVEILKSVARCTQ